MTVIAPRQNAAATFSEDEQPPSSPTAKKLAPPATILLCEDEPLIRFTTTEMLRDFGYSVIEAADGASALSILCQRRVDLLLTDIGLPDMSGVALAERATALDALLPVIFATGHSGVEGLVISPAAHVIRKPYTTQSLYQVIASLLAKPPAS
jgi:CheY-like chemotaxis protein